MATAAISIADLVPSRNELNICALKSPVASCSAREAVVVPDGVGRGGVVLGQVLRALAGGDHVEAGGAAPVDQLADQRGLVAVGHASRRRRLRAARRASSGPASAVGLDVDHDDVLAVRRSRGRRGGAGDRVAGGLEDDLDLRSRDESRRAVGDERGAVRRPRRRCLRRSARAGQPVRCERARRSGVEVGDADDVDARRCWRLREVHRGELAGADHADPTGPCGAVRFCISEYRFMWLLPRSIAGVIRSVGQTIWCCNHDMSHCDVSTVTFCWRHGTDDDSRGKGKG